MTERISELARPGSEVDEFGVSRSRDSANTRQLLLAAARHQFARDGYSGVRVREIATEAGVNVALINRYFMSKEGLFEACLASAAQELGLPEVEDISLDHVIRATVRQVVDSPSGERQSQLLLLLRSSGDARADQIRQNIMRSFAEGMASAAGWRPGDPGSEQTLLRAQLALSAALGIVLLRSSTFLDPLTSATSAELTKPIGDLLSALLA